MNPVSIVIGVGAIAYGCFTLYVRATSPAKLGKLEAMKIRFGPGPGVLIHTLAYSIAPIGIGLLALFRGLNGQSFLGR